MAGGGRRCGRVDPSCADDFGGGPPPMWAEEGRQLTPQRRFSGTNATCSIRGEASRPRLEGDLRHPRGRAALRTPSARVVPDLGARVPSKRVEASTTRNGLAGAAEVGPEADGSPVEHLGQGRSRGGDATQDFDRQRQVVRDQRQPDGVDIGARAVHPSRTVRIPCTSPMRPARATAPSSSTPGGTATRASGAGGSRAGPRAASASAVDGGAASRRRPAPAAGPAPAEERRCCDAGVATHQAR